MSQPRRTIEHLLKQGILPLTHANDAAIHLQVYPSKRSWLVFFDKAMLIIGAIALVLSLVFFIAYNWVNMGKMGKFAFVEGALVVTIALYVALSFRRRFQLIRQMLLLIASVITGSLLALFGQVYQTGADTWQLFFGWAILIIPWVIIARFPALWLLWLGLVNTGLILYFGVMDFTFVSYFYEGVLQLGLVNTGLILYFGVMDFTFVSYFYEGVLQIGVLAAVNFVALNLWLVFIDRQPPSVTLSRFKSELDWSAYVVGLLSSHFITYLAILYVFDDANILMTLIALLLWMSWCGFMVWRFYWYRINLLMLTYLCGSVIVVVMFWAGKLFLDNFDMGGFLILALLLIGMSSAAVVWLRHAARLNSENNLPSAVVKGGNYE